MSGDPTVRLWTTLELEQAEDGKDLWLTTLLLNRATFSEQEIKHYPYRFRKYYSANVDGWQEPFEFYAPNDEMALRYLEAKFGLEVITCLAEKIISWLDVALPTEDE